MSECLISEPAKAEIRDQTFRHGQPPMSNPPGQTPGSMSESLISELATAETRDQTWPKLWSLILQIRPSNNIRMCRTLFFLRHAGLSWSHTGLYECHTGRPLGHKGHAGLLLEPRRIVLEPEGVVLEPHGDAFEPNRFQVLSVAHLGAQKIVRPQMFDPATQEFLSEIRQVSVLG